MKEIGIIEKIINSRKGLYLVNIGEDNDETCHTCPISKICKSNERKIVAYSNNELKLNDKVEIEIIEKNEAKGFIIVFLLPLLVSIVVSTITHFLFSKDVITLISFILSIPLTIIIISKKINYEYIAKIKDNKN